MKKKVAVIFNPVSGKKSRNRILREIRKVEEWEVEILITKYPGHASALARGAVEKGVDFIIAVGGDGTINEIANGIVSRNIPIAIIPKGSGNGLARHLGIPFGVDRSIDLIRKGRLVAIDCGTANGSIFMCTCGMGFDAKISEKIDGSGNRGKFMYVRKVVSLLFHYRSRRYRIRSESSYYEGKAFIATFANCNQYGNNAFIAPGADISDGKIDLTIIGPFHPYSVFGLVIRLFSKKIYGHRKVRHYSSDYFSVERQNAEPIHLDGNSVPAPVRFEVGVIRGGIKIFIP